MNFGNTLQKEGFNAQLSVDLDRFIVVSGAAATAEFNGIINPAPPVDPSMPLGNDWRELSTLEVLQEEIPAGLESQDKLKQVIPQVGDAPDSSDTTAPPAIWKVVRREDNPADFIVRLWVVKVTDKDAA